MPPETLKRLKRKFLTRARARIRAVAFQAFHRFKGILYNNIQRLTCNALRNALKRCAFQALRIAASFSLHFDEKPIKYRGLVG